MPNWDAVIAEHGPTVWRVCWRLLADREAAEDAFQDTFVSVIQFASKTAIENRDAVFVGFATRRALDGLRRRYRTKTLIDRTTAIDVALETTPAPSTSDR